LTLADPEEGTVMLKRWLIPIKLLGDYTWSVQLYFDSLYQLHGDIQPYMFQPEYSKKDSRQSWTLLMLEAQLQPMPGPRGQKTDIVPN
jgi:hypothetical protein